MSRDRLERAEFVSDDGLPAFARGQARGLDLRPDLPLTTDRLVGIDLTHIVHTSDVAAAKGGAGGGGGGSGGGTSSFAPYTSGLPGGYNITIEFKGSWTLDLYNVFKSAADQLTQLIIGDIPNVTVYGSKGRPKTVDDILIPPSLAISTG